MIQIPGWLYYNRLPLERVQKILQQFDQVDSHF